MTQIIAHRGSKINRPENTLASFEEALRVHSDGIEMDVQLSKDQEVVVIHDESVDRTTNGSGLVRELTLEQLKKLDAGGFFDAQYSSEHIPTFREFLALLAEKHFTGLLNVELKTNKFPYPGLVEKTLEILAEFKPEYKVVFSSFNGDSLEEILKINSKAKVANLFEKKLKTARRMHQEHKSEAWHPKIDWARENNLTLPKDLKIRPWTINRAVDLQYCFQKNYDAVITDCPEEAIRLRKRWEK